MPFMDQLTRREVLKSAAALPVAGLLLSQSACTPGQITTDLQLIVTAASAAIDISFPALGILLGPYFTEVTTFIDEADTELASTDSAAIKATKIAQDALSVILPQLPAGLATTVVTDIIAVGTAVTTFLARIGALTAALRSTPAGARAAQVSGSGSLKLTRGDMQALPKILVANAALKAKLAAAIAKTK